MYRYKAVKEKLFHCDIGTYVSYGIKAFADGVEVAFISDVSVDKLFVKRLAKRYTKWQLEPSCLLEAVENALT